MERPVHLCEVECLAWRRLHADCTQRFWHSLCCLLRYALLQLLELRSLRVLELRFHRDQPQNAEQESCLIKRAWNRRSRCSLAAILGHKSEHLNKKCCIVEFMLHSIADVHCFEVLSATTANVLLLTYLKSSPSPMCPAGERAVEGPVRVSAAVAGHRVQSKDLRERLPRVRSETLRPKQLLILLEVRPLNNADAHECAQYARMIATSSELALD